MYSHSETIDVENVVASTDISRELALDSLAMDLSGSEYDPDNFPGLIYRTQEPKAANLIFRSGKIVCTGANTVDDVHSSLQTVCETLRDLGIDVIEDPTITVQNIVSSADLGAQLILTDKRMYTRRTRITPFDGANGRALVVRFQLISSTSMKRYAILQIKSNPEMSC
jgi:TATA-box binding protein (TBP) (component of TFIID and TFIIIB)